MTLVTGERMRIFFGKDVVGVAWVWSDEAICWRTPINLFGSSGGGDGVPL